MKVLATAWLNEESHDENMAANAAFLRRIFDECDDMPVQKVIGMWQGEFEHSFEFTVGQLAQLNAIKRIAFDEFNQEAVLIVNGAGEAIIHLANGTHEFIGMWAEVSEERARLRRGYSIIEGRYFTAIMPEVE